MPIRSKPETAKPICGAIRAIPAISAISTAFSEISAVFFRFLPPLIVDYFPRSQIRLEAASTLMPAARLPFDRPKAGLQTKFAYVGFARPLRA
jgi:hypothetical protein